MDRREFLKACQAAAVWPLWPFHSSRRRPTARVRPADPAWPSQMAWKHLNDDVDGNLVQVGFPLGQCQSSPHSAECAALFQDFKNPYYIRDTPGLTQTLGWVGAWATQPSAYAVAARNANHIAAAVNFARKNNLRLVVKGAGHSYQGTSNAPDSLLIWTRHLSDVAIEPGFVPHGCRATPQRAVTVGAGAIWLEAYDAVTTRAGGYVQGGGCTTVGVAGLVQSGGFGSFSKHFGTAAAGLLQAEVVTADGKVRIANASKHPDLFWALKGGGGGTFGVVSRLTLAVRDLPQYAGGADFTVRASSADSFRRLIRAFVGFYRDALFNPRWGEQAHFNPDNSLVINMVHLGMDSGEAQAVWAPFFRWLAQSPGDYTLASGPVIGSIPFQHWWDPAWRTRQQQDVFRSDPRPNAGPANVWWKGDGGQAGWVIWGYQSLWLPASLLDDSSQQKLADALFAAAQIKGVGLHFNKGLAGAPADALEAARNTATNPAACGAFALAIIGDGEQPAYPGVLGREPHPEAARKAADAVAFAMDQLRAIVPGGGAYVSESSYFQADYKRAYWGANYARLAAIKRKYDRDGLFYVHNGVGSEQWTGDGFSPVVALP